MWAKLYGDVNHRPSWSDNFPGHPRKNQAITDDYPKTIPVNLNPNIESIERAPWSGRSFLCTQTTALKATEEPGGTPDVITATWTASSAKSPTKASDGVTSRHNQTSTCDLLKWSWDKNCFVSMMTPRTCFDVTKANHGLGNSFMLGYLFISLFISSHVYVPSIQNRRFKLNISY